MLCGTFPSLEGSCDHSQLASGNSHEFVRHVPKSLQSVFDQMVVMQDTILEIRQSQEAQEELLRNIIQQEFQSSGNKETQRSLEKHEYYLQSILRKIGVALNDLHHDDGATAALLGSTASKGIALQAPIANQPIANHAPVPWDSSEGVPNGRTHGTPNGGTHGALVQEVQLWESSEGVLNGGSPKHSSDPASPQRYHPTAQIRWSQFQKTVSDYDHNSMYKKVLDKRLEKKSFWHDVFDYFGHGYLLVHEPPDTWCARAADHTFFATIQTVLILSNTCLMGYETDYAIKAALQKPPEDVPQWLDTCNLLFNISFALELIFRMCAFRTWFWVAPSDWAWNAFDTFLVFSSLLSDFLSGINLTFIRTFRIFRVVRVARVIRVLRFFRQLRQMLFAILACLGSLLWAFLFLAMIMFMFSILFLQGSLNLLQDGQDLSDEVVSETKRWYGSLGDAMFSLLAAVTGGIDWLDVMYPLTHAGSFYSFAFVVYMLFVTVGVMNVLTGVFLTSAQDFMDLDLIVQNEQLKVEAFIAQMMELFSQLDLKQSGLIDWPTFSQALKKDHLKAYLRSLELEPIHVHLIFDLLDEHQVGEINIEDLVMGMVRLKGEAKAVDARILQREVSMIPSLLKQFLGIFERREAS